MASLLTRIAEIPHGFDSDDAIHLFEDHLDLIQYVVVSYILLIAYGAPVLEHFQYGNDSAEKDLSDEERKALRAPREAKFQNKVKHAMRVWNLGLSIFSLLGSISSFHLLGYLFSTRSFYLVTCQFDYFAIYDGESAFWVFLFMVSKIPEMMDTVFLILQKKRVIFLHSYHHLTVTVFCWYAGRALYPPGVIFTAMNYFVHTLMYFYYFFSSFKSLRKATSLVAPAVTFLQILQMVVGFAVCVYVSYFSFVYKYGANNVLNTSGEVMHTCGADARVTRMGLLMYGSYFFLFVAFFVNKYVDNGKKKARRERQVDAHVIPGNVPKLDDRSNECSERSAAGADDEAEATRTRAVNEAKERNGSRPNG